MRYAYTALASIVLAMLVWFYARSRDIETLPQVTVPVRVTLAPGDGQFRLETSTSGHNGTVKATFTGTRAAITRLRERIAQKAVLVSHQISRPAPGVTAKQTMAVRITPADFSRPPGVTVSLVPGEDTVEVTVVPIRRQRMRVDVDDRSTQRALVQRYVIVPEEVDVEGPADVLAAHRTIRTMPVAVPPAGDGPATPVPLMTTLGGRPVTVAPVSVTVSAVLRPRTEPHDVEVAIGILRPEGCRFVVKPESLTPSTVKIQVRGPVLQEFDPTQVRVILDLTKRPLKAGLQPGEKLVVHLPPGFELVGEPPKVDQFELVALPAPSPPG